MAKSASSPAIAPPLEGQHLCSMGYQLRDLDEFVDLLQEAGVTVVVDVRETAWSHKPGFSKTRLTETLEAAGMRYLHASFAGNPKELRRELEDHQECLNGYSRYLADRPEVLGKLSEMVRSQGPESCVCLICYERHPDDCHRMILFRKWMAAGGEQFSVKHLGVGGAPRFLKVD